MTALRKNRVNHAYLFSGPRGCGKTTSARILARCLNCAKGPTDTPCGVCPSCVELARGGSGSLDVIEIDAASHGGVDDARDLRERATYAPVRDRYKIFIIDEAHMVTSAGFNALLKIVEEPPEHIKFIFATTEPEKVIGTIRSRTHHYPFRLVPPEPLMAYLELLCKQENVPVAPGVLSLVIRAGAGSVRDSLSVLDQLMAGAGPDGLDYELAVALLGYTHASLLDDVVEAIAASDSATVFRAVDRVIQTGHDPRRFVEDLLERFRDLIIVQAMPESAQSILRGMPADQIARMHNQAHNLGAAELSRAADVTNTALTEMTGATSPRLHLELLCARILLPSAEQTERGIAARIDRVERRLNYAGNDVGAPAAVPPAPAAAATPAAPVQPAAAATPAAPSAPAVPAAQPSPVRQPAAAPVTAQAEREPLAAPRISTNDWPVDESPSGVRRAASEPSPAAAGREAAPPSRPAQPAQEPRPASGEQAVPPVQPAPVQPARVQSASVQPAPPASDSRPLPGTPTARGPESRPEPAAAQTAPPQRAVSAPAGPGADVEVLRRAWPEILQTLTKIKRSTWALVEPNAQVGQFDGQVLTLVFTTSGLAGAFGRADHSENLRQAIHKTIGIDCQITAVAAGSSSAASSEPNPKAPTSRDIPATTTDADWGLAPATPDTTQASAPASQSRADSVASAADRSDAVPSAGGPSDGVPSNVIPAGAQPAAADPVPAASPADSAPAPSSAAAWSAAAAPSADPADASRSAESGPADPAAASRSAESGSADVARADVARTEAALPSGGDARSAAGSQPSHGHGQDSPGHTFDAPQAGAYSYPDDDWGPPLDEDAPPLDEEPPMDWEPAGQAPARPALSSPDHTRTAPAGAAPASVGPASAASGGRTAARETSDDPWTRAVEQAPGVWLLGSESNVGKTQGEPGGASETVPPAPAAPSYEPAAAQVPRTERPVPTVPDAAPFPAAGPVQPPDSGGAPPPAVTPQTDVPQFAPAYAMAGAPASGSHDYGVPAHGIQPHSVPAPSAQAVGAQTAAGAQTQVRVPAFAPSAAPVKQPGAATATVHSAGAATAAPPAPGNGKLSLYQRLSNSPEAEAGRAKAPARQAESAAPFVQDIPSADDETIEESGVFGRAAVERILGGKLIEERSLDGSPLLPRY